MSAHLHELVLQHLLLVRTHLRGRRGRTRLGPLCLFTKKKGRFSWASEVE